MERRSSQSKGSPACGFVVPVSQPRLIYCALHVGLWLELNCSLEIQTGGAVLFSMNETHAITIIPAYPGSVGGMMCMDLRAARRCRSAGKTIVLKCSEVACWRWNWMG